MKLYKILVTTITSVSLGCLIAFAWATSNKNPTTSGAQVKLKSTTESFQIGTSKSSYGDSATSSKTTDSMRPVEYKNNGYYLEDGSSASNTDVNTTCYYIKGTGVTYFGVEDFELTGDGADNDVNDALSFNISYKGETITINKDTTLPKYFETPIADNTPFELCVYYNGNSDAISEENIGAMNGELTGLEVTLTAK